LNIQDSSQPTKKSRWLVLFHQNKYW